MSTNTDKETKQITLSIDDKQVTVDIGASVLDAAHAAGIYIPTLCNHPDLPSYGGCRMCLVEIEKMRGFPPACTTPAQDNMVIKTNTPEKPPPKANTVQRILCRIIKSKSPKIIHAPKLKKSPETKAMIVLFPLEVRLATCKFPLLLARESFSTLFLPKLLLAESYL